MIYFVCKGYFELQFLMAQILKMYFSVVKAMVDPGTSISVDADSHYYTGAMVKSLTLSTEERMVMQ